MVFVGVFVGVAVFVGVGWGLDELDGLGLGDKVSSLICCGENKESLFFKMSLKVLTVLIPCPGTFKFDPSNR
jgi:hypothetical protein